MLCQEAIDRLHRTGLVRTLRSAASEHNAYSLYGLKRVLRVWHFIRYLWWPVRIGNRFKPRYHQYPVKECGHVVRHDEADCE